MAAIHCATAGTVVLESNTAAGRKLLQSGAGRCNFTHLASPDEVARAFGPKGRFLSYSLHRFTPQHVRQFFRRLGLESKVEDDGCVFPVSKRASDVRDVLVNCAKSRGVHFYPGKSVRRLVREKDFFAVHTTDEIIFAKKVIIATGGLSWPQTGSTGDGYRFAQQLGHRIIKAKASLVPLVTRESWPGKMAGASLKDVKLFAVVEGRKVATAGPMIFTDDGIGGPAVLDLSRFLTDYLPNEKNPIEIYIDVVSGVSEAEFDKQIREQIAASPKKTMAGILAFLVPKRVAMTLPRQFDFDAGLLGSALKKDARKKLVRLLKAVPFSIVSTRSLNEAIVTRGGVSVEQIQSKTMESKIVKGLFFAGEVIDVDGPCGGYNLQMCWSTGALAGCCAAEDMY
jgi:hypothetical protein